MKGLVKSIIFCTYDKNGQIIDQIIFEYKFIEDILSSLNDTTSLFCILEEQFRIMILHLLQIDSKLTKYNPGYSLLFFVIIICNLFNIVYRK